MRLTMTDEGFTLQPKNSLYRTLSVPFSGPGTTARWEEVKSATMVKGKMAAPRQGILFRMSDPAQSFVFTSWTKNTTVLDTVAEHHVPVDRGPVKINVWRSASWEGPEQPGKS